jgi:nicotine blue oxidoreductase
MTSRPGPARPVAGLVLAAGEGRRFGGPKALAEVDGDRLVDRAVRVLRAGGCHPVAVVLGAAVVEVPGADVVVDNTAWREGMGSSLRAGLSAPRLRASGAVVVVLVDQPDISARAVRRLLQAYAGGAGLATATYGGRRGHPVLLGREHWPGVAAAAVDDAGARDYLATHPADVVEVPCDDAGADDDVDTPEALAGRSVLDRMRGDGSTSAALAAGLGELSGLVGGAGERARREEKAAEAVRRDDQEQGAPPFDVDLDEGVARIRRPPPVPSDP